MSLLEAPARFAVYAWVDFLKAVIGSLADLIVSSRWERVCFLQWVARRILLEEYQANRAIADRGDLEQR